MRPTRSLPLRAIRKHCGRVLTTFLLLIDFGFDALNLKPKLAVDSDGKELIEDSHGRVAIFAGYISTENEALEAERVLRLLSDKFDLLLLINTGSIRLKIDLPNFYYFHRRNFGRDLASYKYALDSLNLEKTFELFLFNDSVLWTENSIVSTLANFRRSGFQVTSLTSSEQYSYHLQSYALHLKGDVSEISKAFSAIRVSNIKRVIVEAGEKRLSQYWIKKEIQVGSIYTQDSLFLLLAKYKELYGQDYSEITALVSQGVPLNPSIHFWAPLFGQSGVVKKVLMAMNPAQLKYVPKNLKELESKITLEKLN